MTPWMVPPACAGVDGAGDEGAGLARAGLAGAGVDGAEAAGAACGRGGPGGGGGNRGAGRARAGLGGAGVDGAEAAGAACARAVSVRASGTARSAKTARAEDRVGSVMRFRSESPVQFRSILWRV